jgi:hypothetical protein
MNARAALAGSSYGLGAACEGSDADALGSAPIGRSGEAVARERRDASRGAGGSAVAGSAGTARGGGSMTRKATSMAFKREMGAALGAALRVDSTTK